MKLQNLRERLAMFILGPTPALNDIVEDLYQKVWPKHADFKDQTLQSMSVAIVTAYCRGKIKARNELR